MRARAAAWRTDWREGSVTRGFEAVIFGCVVVVGVVLVVMCVLFALASDDRGLIQAAMGDCSGASVGLR